MIHHRTNLWFREFSWVLYALPCIFVWSVYLLSFFPGSMSPDSIEQWKQLLTFRFVDLHPAFHTLTNWLITRAWLSPAAVAIVQIVALAVVFGWAMRELEFMNVPLWTRIVITFLFSLSPVNGFMSITLWKDVAFTISVLALWMLLLRIVRTDDSALKSPRFLIALTLVLVLVSLYRYNGLPVVILLLAMLWWLYEKYRRRFLLIGVAWAMCFISIKVVLYGLLGVAPPPVTFVYMLPIHQVVALRQSASLTPHETRFLNSMAQPEFWNFYRCSVPNAAIYLSTGSYAGQFNQEFFASHVSDFIRVWATLAIQNPSTLVEHQLCLTNMLWRMFPLSGSYLYTAQLGIIPNNLGLQTKSLLPQMQSFLTRVYDWSMSPSISWWFWRPALHFCLIMAFLLFVPFSRRHMAVLLSIPLFQTVVLLLFTAGQDTRYQYPLYVIMLIAPGLLLARKTPAVSTV